jgi:CAAX amino terminal protease family protein
MNFDKLKNNSRNILKSIGLIILALVIYDVVSNIVGGFGNSFFTEEQIEVLSYYFFDTVICVVTCILLFFVYYFTSRKKTGLVLADAKMPKWLIVPFAIIITLGMGLVSSLWLDFAYTQLANVPFVAQSVESFDSAWSTIGEDPYIWVCLSVVVFGPIAEELLFRGIIHNSIKKVCNPYVAIVLSGLMFGIWHGEFVQTVYTTFFGIALAVVYEYSGSLWVPIGMHILNNFTSTLPPALDTTSTYLLITRIEEICLLPTILLLIYMIRAIHKKEKENHEINSVSC